MGDRFSPTVIETILRTGNLGNLGIESHPQQPEDSLKIKKRQRKTTG